MSLKEKSDNFSETAKTGGILKEFIFSLIQGELTTEQWRVVFRLGLIATFGFHILLACSLIPGLEKYGFVQAGTIEEVEDKIGEVDKEVDGVRNQVADIQRQMDVKDLEQMQERVCIALKENNRVAVRYASERKADLIRSFRDANGRTPYIPSCEELGINGEEPEDE